MIAIPNMEKPKRCKECSFKTCFIRVNIKSYTCLINGGECEKTDCPLIEISETKYHNMVVALDILEHEQNDCIEAERRADGDI